MSYELTLEQFENINLFSNRNVEKVLTGVVNSSSNAALVNMGEDAVILLDHKNGDFYIADYEFDRKNLTVEFKNFEPIELVKDDAGFEEDVKKVFESDDGEIDFSVLSESYRRNVAEKDSFLNELVSFTMSRKSFDGPDYDALKEAVEQVEAKSRDRKFFEEYKERLNSYPLMEAKRFDWQNPVKVSLVETEKQKLVNRSAIEKAHELWKKDTFKEAYQEAALAFIEDVEEGTEKFKELFESFPQIYFLDAGDRRTLFGKAALSSNELRENMDDLLKGIDILFEKTDIKDIRSSYLAEAEEEDFEEIGGTEDEEVHDYEAPSELEGPDIETIVADLRRIMDKCEDQKSKGKLEDLIDRLSTGVEEGTRPDLVKEAVAILNI